MVFEWDEVKNRVNIRKHGVGFETAKRIFEGPVLTRIDLRREYGEERSISIGRIDRAAVIVVAYTERDGRIHLIFARTASRKERQAHHERTR